MGLAELPDLVGENRTLSQAKIHLWKLVRVEPANPLNVEPANPFMEALFCAGDFWAPEAPTFVTVYHMGVLKYILSIRN